VKSGHESGTTAPSHADRSARDACAHLDVLSHCLQRLDETRLAGSGLADDDRHRSTPGPSLSKKLT
jgi:hypothetical protein